MKVWTTIAQFISGRLVSKVSHQIQSEINGFLRYDSRSKQIPIPYFLPLYFNCTTQLLQNLKASPSVNYGNIR